MMTRTPRRAAVEEYSATPRGSRCADSACISKEMPRSSSSLAAASITSRSDSEPMRIPTWGPLASSSAHRCLTSGAGEGRSGMYVLRVLRGEADVAAMMRPRDPDRVDAEIGAPAGGMEVGPDRGHVEDAAAGGLDVVAVRGGAGVEDGDALDLLRVVDSCDRVADLGGVRIPAGGDDAADAGRLGRLPLAARQRAGGGPPQQRQEVAAGAGQDHLRLG